MGQIYQANIMGSMYNQEVQNRWFYWSDSNVDLSEKLADLVGEFLVGLLMEISTIAIEWTSVRVKEAIFNQFAHTTILNNAQGQVVGEALSQFNAVNVRFNVASGLTRGGAKRLAGMVESYVDAGKLTTGGQAVYNGVANLLAQSLSDGVDTFQPLVLRKVVAGYYVNPISSGGGATWSTQNSHKAYKGGGTPSALPLVGTQSTVTPVALSTTAPALVGKFIPFDPKTPPTTLGTGRLATISGNSLVLGTP